MEIYVDTEEQKQDLLLESKYIHDFTKVIKIRNGHGKVKARIMGLDSDKCNTFMHIYLNPDMIIVRSK